MAKYRTALGKVVDMGILAAKNEKTRAVGNMKVNARGDTIDNKGNIIKPATSKVNEAYSKTVGNRASHAVKKQVKPTIQHPTKVPAQRQTPSPTGGVNQRIEEQVPVQLTADELELDRELEDDELTEQIKAMEVEIAKAKK